MGHAHLDLRDHHAVAPMEMRLVVAAPPARHLVVGGPRMAVLLVGVQEIADPQLAGRWVDLGALPWQ